MNISIETLDFQHAIDERASALAAEVEQTYRRQMQCVFPRTPTAVKNWRPELPVVPPTWERPGPSGTVKTAEDAKEIAWALKAWAGRELRGAAGEQLSEALDDIISIMSFGASRVSEALLRVAVGMDYLDRWLGREKVTQL